MEANKIKNLPQSLRNPKHVKRIFSTLSPVIRVQLMQSLKGSYCESCGLPQPKGRSCQCWNDE